MRLLALVAGLLLALPAAADMEVYHPRHRTGEDLERLALAAMEGEGSVVIDGNTGALILIGSPDAITQALALLASQDRKLRTVLVRSETRSAQELSSLGYRVTWSVGGGSLRVGNVERAGAGADILLGASRGSGAGSHGSMVRVLEGEWGRIAQGHERLVPTGSYRHPGAVLLSAESGLEVRPRILGDGRVRLDLRPFQGNFQSGGVVSHQGAETTVVVEPGRTAVVGGIERSGQVTSGSVAGGGLRASGANDALLLVTVTLDDDGEAEDTGPDPKDVP